MRAPLLTIPLLLLAACGGGKDNAAAANQAAANQLAAAQRTPPPKTPVLDVPTAGNGEGWIEPQDGAADPKHAPYGNVLSEPVIDAPSQRN